VIVVEDLTSNSSIRHGFFTREGGVSGGLYNSLNCGFGSADAPENVAENRGRVLQSLKISDGQLLTCYQVHSAKAITVNEAWSFDNAPEADGMATNKPGLVLSILTADCTPVLFADDQAGVIGAAHAGWQGAFTGILEATIAEMVDLGASYGGIKAAIGPSIGQDSYEIGPEFFARFVDGGQENEIFFKPSIKEGHYMFDLTGYVEARLRILGVGEIYQTGYDTCKDEARFYSYRRSVLQGEEDYGREISAISLSA
jgi:polyphenol oxidase